MLHHKTIHKKKKNEIKFINIIRNTKLIPVHKEITYEILDNLHNEVAPTSDICLRESSSLHDIPSSELKELLLSNGILLFIKL